jgi:hypothetical protein
MTDEFVGGLNTSATQWIATSAQLLIGRPVAVFTQIINQLGHGMSRFV